VRSRPLLALALAAAFDAFPALAAVARPTSIEDLARGSAAVVRGTVQRTSPRWSGDGRRILTDVEISVAGVWRGSAPDRVVVTVPGGIAGGVGQRVDGAAVFTEGEEVVAFLARVGDGWTVAGHALGKFRVEGAAARPDLSSTEMPRGPLAPGERTVEPMGLDELEARVRAAR